MAAMQSRVTILRSIGFDAKDPRESAVKRTPQRAALRFAFRWERYGRQRRYRRPHAASASRNRLPQARVGAGDERDAPS